MATKASTKNISVRRNRDYYNVFKWTPTLNDEIYGFYVTAREDKSKRYMKRMESLWDTKYPMFSHLSDRKLRERAVFVQTKRNSTMADENNSASGCAVTTNKNQDGDHNISKEDNPPSFMSGVNIDELKQSFIKNFKNTYCKELSERQYVTKANGFIKEELLTTMNNIITDFIKHRTTPLLFWEINCIQLYRCNYVTRVQWKTERMC